MVKSDTTTPTLADIDAMDKAARSDYIRGKLRRNATEIRESPEARRRREFNKLHGIEPDTPKLPLFARDGVAGNEKLQELILDVAEQYTGLLLIHLTDPENSSLREKVELENAQFIRYANELFNTLGEASDEKLLFNKLKGSVVALSTHTASEMADISRQKLHGSILPKSESHLAVKKAKLANSSMKLVTKNKMDIASSIISGDIEVLRNQARAKAEDYLKQ